MPKLRDSVYNSKTPSPNGNGRNYEENNVESLSLLGKIGNGKSRQKIREFSIKMKVVLSSVVLLLTS